MSCIISTHSLSPVMPFQPLPAAANCQPRSVRPLVTGDRKRRLLSGREQISNDGRHLIDGVPFGRPRLRSPRDRPPVDIPPLKRRRIEYDTIEQDDEQIEPLYLTRNGEGSEDRESTRQVRFNNAGFDANEDEEEDDDFVDQEQYGDDEEEEEGEDEDDDYEINPDELADELEGLQEAESREETPAEDDNIQKPADISPTKSQKSIDLSDIDRIAALRAAFPRASVDECERLLLQHGSDEKKVYWRLRRRNRPHMTLQQMLAYRRRLQVQGPETAMEDEVEEEASEKSDAESIASLVKHYDEHGFPAGSILDGSASRHMVEALRMSGQDVKLPVHKKFDDDEDDEGTVQPAKVAAPTDENEIPLDSDDDSEEDLDFDEDQEDLSENASDDSDAVSLSDEAEEVLDEEDLNESSDEGSAASDSESGPEVYTTKVKPPAEMVAPKSPQPNDESSSSDESDSDSSSDDDSSSEEDASSNDSDSEDREDDSSDDSTSGDSDSSSGDSFADNDNANSDHDVSSTSGSNSSDSDDDSDDEPVTSGSKHTNITRAVFQPISQPSGTLDPATLEASSAPSDRQDQSPVPPGQGKNKTRKRNTRRRLSAKMRKTASRDTSIIGSTSAQDETSTPADLEAKRMALLQSLGHLEYLGKPAVVKEPVEKAAEKPAVPVTETQKPEQSSADSITVTPPKRKAKLDVDAGRRMLFGSLGLKNPKSQEDEEKIRASLMKGVKPLVNHRVEDAEKEAEASVTEVDPDAWRQKINYTAVECVEEGIELSEPPFPFYQRWDPQQQKFWKSGRGGPSKRKQQNDEEYEEEEEEPGTKKRKVSDEEENVVLNYDEEDPDAYAAEGHHEEQEEEEYDEEYNEEQYDHEEQDNDEDLPPLPADLSTLPQLQPGQARVGMVITWKQFLLSKATNWQPQVLNMTGTVVEVWDQNDLRILLAKRDRNLDVNEKVYDDEGNRVYDKFEVPEDEDDADDDAEKGYRTINFADIMEPRVLRPSEDEVLVPETQHQDNMTPANEDVDSKASSRTLDHKVPSEPESQTAQEQESFIPDTVHESSHEPQAAQVTSAGNVSIVDDLRPEASLVGTGSRPEESSSRPVEPASASHQHPNVSNPSPQPETAPEPPSSPQHGPSAPPSENHNNTPPRSSALGDDELPDVTDLPSQELESQDHQRPPSRSSAYLESQRITLGPFNGFSDGLEQVADNRGSYVSYARLEVIPSDTGSIRSGRQPDPEFSVDLGNNEILDRFEPAGEDDVPVMGPDEDEDMAMAGADDVDDNEEDHEDDNEEEEREEEEDGQEEEEADDQENQEEEQEDIEGDQQYNVDEDQQDIEEDEQEDSGEESQQSTPRRKRASLSEEPASPALSDMSASTDDSFPSLSQATTTKSSQRKASQQAKSNPKDAVATTSQTRKSLDAANRDYEQTMKRLDEEESSQESTTMDDTQVKLEKRRQLSELAHKLARTPIERPARKLPFRRTSTPSKLKQTTTATTKSTRTTRFSGSFVIPEGSQVITLSSSPEPEPNEDYADDDVDETYHESSPATSQRQHRAPPSTAPNASASFSTPRRNLFSTTRLSSTQVAASPRRSQPSIITGSLRKNNRDRGSASSSSK